MSSASYASFKTRCAYHRTHSALEAENEARRERIPEQYVIAEMYAAEANGAIW